MKSESTTLTASSSIQVIDRLVSLLDAIEAQKGASSLKYLSADTQLHPSTAFRILSALQVHGLVQRDADGHYLLGAKLRRYASHPSMQVDIRKEALPVMNSLRDKVGETVNLTIREGDQVVYIERALPQRMMRVEQVIGSRAPLHVTAVGKLMLAEGGRQACNEYAKRTGLPRYTGNTITQSKRLFEETQAALSSGFARDDEEAEIGVACIGVLIYDAGGTAVAGLSISAPRERHQEEWVELIKDAGRQISRRIGCTATL